MSQIGIFLANGVEEIEALTVVDLVRRAGLTIDMISIETELLMKGSHGIQIQADRKYSETDFEQMDMIVLPGGSAGTKRLSEFQPLCEKIKEFHQKGKMLAAICAAPSVLGENGILKGKKAVCYPGFEEKLVGAEVLYESVVRDGNVITSRGLGTAIEFACAVIDFYLGKESADKIKDSILYTR